MAKKNKARVEAVLASIDENMETAITAGVVDHETQMSSWTSEESATETLLETVITELDKAPEEVQAPLADSETLPESPQPTTLADLTASQSDDATGQMVVEVADQMDNRVAFEIHQDPDNTNIHRTLKKVRSQLVTKRAARLLLAVNIEPSFINRTVHTGSAYNVYALGKLADLIYGVTDGVVANAINVACMKSLFAFNKAGATFTMECAKGAASKQYARTVDPAVRSFLISHTVSPSTAPTQASSTMQALVTLGVCKTNGSGKNAVYTVLDTPIAHKLEELMAA